MKTAVITGSTSGIGFGLANELLEKNCQVVISGRSEESVEQAVNQLTHQFPNESVFGIVCNMQDKEAVINLWQMALERFGKIDIWVNNAGIGQRQNPLPLVPIDEVKEVITTNVIGAIYGAQVALEGMQKQGFGAIYNMEGLGSSGRVIRGQGVYGTSKAALSYLTKVLVEEVKNTSLIVGGLQPGMVVTNMVTKQRQDSSPEEWEKMKQIFNIIANKVEDVTRPMAEHILTNSQNGKTFRYMNSWKMMVRFMLAPIRKRDLFAE